MRRHLNHLAAKVIGLLGLIILVFGCASQPEIKPSDTQAAEERITAVQSVIATENEENVQVVIMANGPLTYSALKQPDPPAVVLYLPQTDVDKLAPIQAVGKGPVISISARNGSGNNTARMEIGLLEDTAYQAEQNGSNITLTFNKQVKNRQVSETIERAQASGAQPVVTKAGVSENKINEVIANSSKATRSRPGEPIWVNKIDFLSEQNGTSSLVIGTTDVVNYNIKKSGPQQIEVILHETNIPSYRQRPLITTRFNSAVNRVMPVQPSKDVAETLITIDLRESVPFTAEQTDNLLFIHFEPSTIPPKPMEQANLPAWKQAQLSDSSQEYTEMPVNGGDAPKAEPYASEQVASTADTAEIRMLMDPRPKTYTGEKIALDFFETDIKNVFRILREVSGKNFAIDKDVTGKVTMTLDKPVPWDQVLDLVLRMNQLGMAQEGAIIRIATLSTLKQEEDLRKSRLEALKQAREDVKALEPLVTKYFPVSYSNAASEVKPHIELILTKDRGSVSVDEKNNQIIVTDTAAVVKQAEEVVRRIDRVTSQVVIEAKVVEVSNTFSRELGVAWSIDNGPGDFLGLSTEGNLSMNYPSSGGSSIGINFSRLTGVPFVLDAKLNALDANGEGKILSSPKILTLDNKKARIKQGVEYPYMERDSSGGSSVKFKNIDLLLEVTPHVTPDNRISLTIFITKNDVAGITAGVPSVSTNEAETELLVNDGDTVVIGGIIKSTESSGSTGFPGLNKIPVLGWLFKNNTNSSQNNELLIFITPRIVQLEQATAELN